MTPGPTIHTGAWEVISYYNIDYTNIKATGIKLGSGSASEGLKWPSTDFEFIDNHMHFDTHYTHSHFRPIR